MLSLLGIKNVYLLMLLTTATTMRIDAGKSVQPADLALQPNDLAFVRRPFISFIHSFRDYHSRYYHHVSLRLVIPSIASRDSPLLPNAGDESALAWEKN